MLLASPRWRAVLPQLTAAAALAAALCLPLMVEYRAMASDLDLEDRGFVGMLFPPRAVIPPIDRPLAYLAERARTGERIHVIATLAPWAGIVLGALVVLLRRGPRRIESSLVVAVALGGLANYWYALGSARYLGLPSLYALLSDVGGLGVVRGPIRATQYYHFAVCVVGGVGLGAAFARVSRRTQAALATAVVTLSIVETGWRGVPLARAPERASVFADEIARLPPGCAIAELPATVEQGVRALWHSTAHWRPVLNGYGGLFPMRPRHTYRLLNRFPAPESLRFLHEAGVCAVVVRTRDDASVLMRAARMHLEVIRRGDEALIRVPSAPPVEPDPPVVAADGFRVVEPAGDGDVLLDGDRTTVLARVLDPRSDRARITIDLGAPRTVGGLVLFLGSHWRLHLPEYRVDASLDGHTWRTVSAVDVVAPPLASYRARADDVRQTIRFAPTETRYLRIGPYGGRSPVPWQGLAVEWGATEIGVVSGS